MFMFLSGGNRKMTFIGIFVFIFGKKLKNVYFGFFSDFSMFQGTIYICVPLA